MILSFVINLFKIFLDNPISYFYPILVTDAFWFTKDDIKER